MFGALSKTELEKRIGTVGEPAPECDLSGNSNYYRPDCSRINLKQYGFTDKFVYAPPGYVRGDVMDKFIAACKAAGALGGKLKIATTHKPPKTDPAIPDESD